MTGADRCLSDVISYIGAPRQQKKSLGTGQKGFRRTVLSMRPRTMAKFNLRVRYDTALNFYALLTGWCILPGERSKAGCCHQCLKTCLGMTIVSCPCWIFREWYLHHSCVTSVLIYG